MDRVRNCAPSLQSHSSPTVTVQTGSQLWDPPDPVPLMLLRDPLACPGRNTGTSHFLELLQILGMFCVLSFFFFFLASWWFLASQCHATLLPAFSQECWLWFVSLCHTLVTLSISNFHDYSICYGDHRRWCYYCNCFRVARPLPYKTANLTHKCWGCVWLLHYLAVPPSSPLVGAPHSVRHNNIKTGQLEPTAAS